MKIKEVIATLENFAPLPLQESFDNAGLQVGLTAVESSGVLLCLDVTEDVLAEAIHLGCNLIISHHPLIFHPLKTVSERSLTERCVRMAIQHNLTIYSAHTNLDNALGGVNFKMAELLNLQDVHFLIPNPQGGGSGLIGTLQKPTNAQAFLTTVQKTFGVVCLQHNTPRQRPIQSVALCGGAGDFLLDEAIRQKADAFLTGEMHYHMYFGHDEEIQIAVLGHFQSEQYTIQLLGQILRSAYPKMPVHETRINTNPIQYLIQKEKN